MKKSIFLLLLVINVSFLFAEKGAYADKIYYNIKMSEELAVKDIAEGISDIYMTSISSNLYRGLDQKIKEKLEVYTVPSGSWDFLLNPYPNQAPYQVKKGNVTYFNPFANKNIRFAVNHLVNRKYIVDEIQGGSGGPAFTPATPGQPNAWRIDIVANRMGLTEDGNYNEAVSMIEKEMRNASKLPENKGRIKKKNGKWYFDNKPITIKFLMRVDDPEGRLKLGNYFSDILEKVGFTVEKLEWDRIKCIETIYYDDPANYNWNIYTEGWVAGSTYIWWSTAILQHMTSQYTNMPGWGVDKWWNYRDEKIEKIAQDISNGNILTLDEYWKKIENVTELALDNSVRIFLTYQNEYYITNKKRFAKRLPYGVGDGFNRWTIENAKTEDKTLKILQKSAAGGLFMSPWDPIGSNGFSDAFTMNVVSPIFDRAILHDPFGFPIERGVSLVCTESKPYRDENGELKGNIEIDSDAKLYDKDSQTYKKIGSGKYAVTKSTYKIKFGKWHHGRKIDINDYIYADAFVYEWTYKIDENDKTYNSQYASYFKDGLEQSLAAWKINEDNTVTVWSNSYFPSSVELERAAGAPGLKVMASAKPGFAVPWELTEAISLLLSKDDAKSGNKYGLTSDKETEAIDLKSEILLEDLKYKLDEMINEKHIPIMLKGKVDSDTAIQNYKLLKKWLNEKSHAVVGYGPYYLEKLDNKKGYAELRAFRDNDYPFEVGEFEKYYKQKYIKIDSISYPDILSEGEDLQIEIDLSEYIFPSRKSKPASEAMVSVYLLTDDKYIKYEAPLQKEGRALLNIAATDITKLNMETIRFIVSAGLNENYADIAKGEIIYY